MALSAFSSFKEQHMDELKKLEAALPDRHILIGDLNTGPKRKYASLLVSFFSLLKIVITLSKFEN